MEKRFDYSQLDNFTISLFKKIGCKTNDAKIISKVLLTGDTRGIPSHGLIRALGYIGLWEKGRITEKPIVNKIHETPSTATLDAGNGFGMIAAQKAMELAIKKAKKSGTGWVSVINSNHFGIAGYYAMMALEHDMIGITTTNASPLVAPTWSTSKYLGTNPLAVAIPAQNHLPFVADFATTPIAQGKLAILENKKLDCSLGYVQDKDGKPSTNPAILKEDGAILPLGSDYEHGSHKGYCMGAIVDIFSSVLGGANFGPYTPPQVAFLPLHEKSVGKGIGHFFGAMRIDAFRPAQDFKSSIDEWIETFKTAKPAVGQKEVLIPGEPEHRHTKFNSENGIPLMQSTIDELNKLALKYKITPLK